MKPVLSPPPVFIENRPFGQNELHYYNQWLAQVTSEMKHAMSVDTFFQMLKQIHQVSQKKDDQKDQ
jgi:hypothetical protein